MESAYWNNWSFAKFNNCLTQQSHDVLPLHHMSMSWAARPIDLKPVCLWRWLWTRPKRIRQDKVNPECRLLQEPSTGGGLIKMLLFFPTTKETHDLPDTHSSSLIYINLYCVVCYFILYYYLLNYVCACDHISLSVCVTSATKKQSPIRICCHGDDAGSYFGSSWVPLGINKVRSSIISG